VGPISGPVVSNQSLSALVTVLPLGRPRIAPASAARPIVYMFSKECALGGKSALGVAAPRLRGRWNSGPYRSVGKLLERRDFDGRHSSSK
jgi:hypothetical protein